MRFLEDLPTAAPISATPALKAIAAPSERLAAPDKAAMEAHLARGRYGDFTLTEAIRPGWQLDVVPHAGYRHDSYVDPQSGARLPALIAAVSSEDLFDVFLELLAPLGDTIARLIEVPVADAPQMMAAAGLLAEGELPPSVLPHRRAGGLLPGASRPAPRLRAILPTG